MSSQDVPPTTASTLDDSQSLLRLSPPPSATPCDLLAVDASSPDDLVLHHPLSTSLVDPTSSSPESSAPLEHSENTPPTDSRTIQCDLFSALYYHELPLSPSMTPPIVLEEEEEVEDVCSNGEECDAPSADTTKTESPDHDVNSPLSLAGDLVEEEVAPQTEEHEPPSPPPRLTRSRLGSLRRGRSSARFSPYAAASRSSTTTTSSHQGVLRPINDDLRILRHSSTSCDTSSNSSRSTTTLDSTSGSTTTTTSQQLTIDTALANSQCAAAQHQSRAAKTALAQRIQAVIDEDDYEHFLDILRRNKPDLNVFVNGQTALHYCLLRGRSVSWCKQLVLFGANPNLSSQDGWHPLHLAAFNGLNDNLNYLISCNNTNDGQQVK